MIWRTPELNEERGRWAFAFLPVECEEGVTVWLRWYWRVQSLRPVWVPHPGRGVLAWRTARCYADKPQPEQAIVSGRGE